MTTKAKTSKPKANQYIRAVIEGRVGFGGAFLDIEGDHQIPVSAIKSFEVIESPAETLDLPSKIGTVILVDPTNKHNMLAAYIRIKADEFGNCWDNYGDAYTSDDFAQECIKYGYKVVQ